VYLTLGRLQDLAFRGLRKSFLLTTEEVLGTITHVATQDPVVALTFDDGPHPEYTPRLLDILESHTAHATFFMVGEAAQRYPEIVRRVAQAGHAIGNHSWDHPSFPLLTRRERRTQIRACERFIAPYGQRLFRPPYGEQNLASRLDLLWLRHKVVMFNCEVGDWWDPVAKRMTAALLKHVKPGSIICLHDALFDDGKPKAELKLDKEPYVNREAMLEAVRVFLEATANKLQFVTLPELFAHGRLMKTNWYSVRTTQSYQTRTGPL
jgi:peptidoglycan-N-acetylglucosamine deacetylase